MRTKKRSDEVNEDGDLPFMLGELVLCRYSSYPYWPATVDQTHQKGCRGKFVRYGTKSDGSRILTFWCTFSDEDTGGWVRADRMVRFHPNLVDKIRVGEDHDLLDDQSKALDTALADFKKLNKNPEDVPVPKPPEDFGKGLDGDDDFLESIGEEETPESEPESGRRRKSGSRRKSTGTAVSSPKKSDSRVKAKESRSAKRKSAPAAHPLRSSKKVKTDGKKRKRDEDEDMDDADEEPPVSRKRRTSKISPRDEDDGDSSDKTKDLEEKLNAANDTIATLRRRLRKRENKIAEISDESTPVRVIGPDAPENLAVPKRLASNARSKPVTSDQFAQMFKQLHEDFTEFKTLVLAADDSRLALDRETKAAQEQFQKLISHIKSCEEKAADKEKIICSKLTDVLEADISIEALRAHKAGNYIKSMGKACKLMPLINHLCAEIRSTWMTQVKQFMKQQSAGQENGGSPDQENPADTDQGSKDDKTAADTAGSPAGEKSTPDLSKEGDAGNGEKDGDKPTEEAPQARGKESKDGSGNSEGVSIEAATPEKEADKAEAKPDTKAEGGVKGEDAAHRDSAASGAKSENKGRDVKAVGEKATENKDAIEVDDVTTGADTNVAASAEADAKGSGLGEKASTSQGEAAPEGSKTSPIAAEGSKDDAGGDKPATGTDKGGNEGGSGSLGKASKGPKATDADGGGVTAKDAASKQGDADVTHSDEKGSRRASPKREQAATVAGDKSEATDTPRSVTVPADSKVEQGEKGRSDLPPGAPRDGAGEDKNPTVSTDVTGKAQKKGDDRPKGEEKKPPTAVVGKEAAAS